MNSHATAKLICSEMIDCLYNISFLHFLSLPFFVVLDRYQSNLVVNKENDSSTPFSSVLCFFAIDFILDPSAFSLLLPLIRPGTSRFLSSSLPPSLLLSLSSPPSPPSPFTHVLEIKSPLLSVNVNNLSQSD